MFCVIPELFVMPTPLMVNVSSGGEGSAMVIVNALAPAFGVEPEAALEAGAAACLFKDTLSKDLIRVIREVCSGGSSLEPQVKAILDQRARMPALTAREVEIIKLVAEMNDVGAILERRCIGGANLFLQADKRGVDVEQRQLHRRAAQRGQERRQYFDLLV